MDICWFFIVMHDFGCNFSKLDLLNLVVYLLQNKKVDIYQIQFDKYNLKTGKSWLSTANRFVFVVVNSGMDIIVCCSYKFLLLLFNCNPSIYDNYKQWFNQTDNGCQVCAGTISKMIWKKWLLFFIYNTKICKLTQMVWPAKKNSHTGYCRQCERYLLCM